MFRKLISANNNLAFILTYSWYAKAILQVAISFILLSFSVATQAEESRSALSITELTDLAPKIEAVESSLINIKLDSEVWVETKADLSDPCEPWQRTPIYASCTAWFEGHPEGRVRVDMHKQVLKWRDGAAPYGESSYSAGFDGQYGRVVHHTTGHSGKTHLIKEGKIFPDAPNCLTTGWCEGFTGRAFSLNFFFSEEGYTFSDLFRWADDPNTKVLSSFEFMREVFQRVKCIKMASRGTKRSQQSWWLDPSRGFALLGYKWTGVYEDGSERLIRFIKVSTLKKVAPGIWWPTQVTSVRASFEPGEPYRRFVYRASNVVANDPNFADSIFTVPFPDGYLIDDKVAGRKYRVGEDPNAPKNQSKK